MAIADPATIDPGVVLGYRSGRALAEETLVVGPGAHLRSGTVLYAGSRIGAAFETGHHVIVREENQIGDEVRVWSNSVVDYGCTIGNRVRIHTNVYVAQFTLIEDDAFLAPGVSLANDRYPVSPAAALTGPIIRRGARLGVNVTVLPGVEVGADSLVGAGAVVVRDVPAGATVAGNPAQVLPGRAPPPPTGSGPVA